MSNEMKQVGALTVLSSFIKRLVKSICVIHVNSCQPSFLSPTNMCHSCQSQSSQVIDLVKFGKHISQHFLSGYLCGTSAEVPSHVACPPGSPPNALPDISLFELAAERQAIYGRSGGQRHCIDNFNEQLMMPSRFKIYT